MILRRTDEPQEVLTSAELDALHGDGEPSEVDPDAGRSASSRPEAQAAASPEAATAEARPQARNVLVVVRSREDGSLIESHLRRLGHASTVIRNPFRALDELRAARRDLILTDVDLWADDGALLFDRLRAAGDPTPVVFLGEGDERLQLRARRAGAADALTRPLRPDDLGACLRALVSVEKDGPDAASEAARERARGVCSVSSDPGAPWLRFFFEVRRELRGVHGRRERLDVVLAGVCRWLRAAAVIEAQEVDEGTRLTVVAVAPGGAQPEGGPRTGARAGARSAVAGRVAERVREALCGEAPPRLSFDARGTLVLPVPGLDRRRGWLVIEFPDAVPPSAETYVQELGMLVRDEVAGA